MLSNAEVILAEDRLVDGKLIPSDVTDLITSYRLVLGPLETDYPDLRTKLEALDDLSDSDQRAAKQAAILIRLQGEDFGVSTITGGLINSDHIQRRLFLVYGFGLLYPLPWQLMTDDIKLWLFKTRFSQSIKTVTIP